jgi:hypothetical protein
VKYHWFREQIKPNHIKMRKVSIDEQLGDIFTKGLRRVTEGYVSPDAFQIMRMVILVYALKGVLTQSEYASVNRTWQYLSIVELDTIAYNLKNFTLPVTIELRVTNSIERYSLYLETYWHPTSLLNGAFT